AAGAGLLVQSPRRGRRRRLRASGAESRSRAARARGEVGLRRAPARSIRLHRDALVSRAGARARRRAPAAAAAPARPPPARARDDTWAARRRDTENRLRTTARQSGDDARAGDRQRTSYHGNVKLKSLGVIGVMLAAL